MLGSGLEFNRTNFLSGSTPPKSTKRNRLSVFPLTKKKAPEGELFVRTFLDCIFGRFRTNHEVVLFFFRSEPGKHIVLHRGTRQFWVDAVSDLIFGPYCGDETYLHTPQGYDSWASSPPFYRVDRSGGGPIPTRGEVCDVRGYSSTS